MPTSRPIRECFKRSEYTKEEAEDIAKLRRESGAINVEVLDEDDNWVVVSQRG